MYKNKIDNILTGLFVMIIFLCVALITKDVINYKKADKEYNRLKKYISYPTESFNADNSENSDFNPEDADGKDMENPEKGYDYERLYEINHDLVGILSIPSLDLMYPVVQSSDNIKYLNTTFEGNKNPAGCLFIDYENSRDLSDPNTYVYGHNMKDGSMFGSLKKIIKDKQDEKDTKAYMQTGTDRYTYSLEKAEVVNIYEYKPHKTTEDLLTLYTCWGNDKSKRLLVTFLRD